MPHFEDALPVWMDSIMVYYLLPTSAKDINYIPVSKRKAEFTNNIIIADNIPAMLVT